MFNVDVRLQIASLIFLVIIVCKYFFGKRLPLLSAHMFSALLICGCVNLGFDIATVYTVSHINEVSPLLNDILHRCFIISVNTLAVVLYLYVMVQGRHQKRFCVKDFLLLIPYVLAFAFALFGRIEYYVAYGHAYSYGPVPYTIFGCTSFYMIAVIFMAAKLNFSKEKRRAIIIGSCFWIAAVIFQSLIPYILVSGLAVVALILFIYLSLENPREYRDTDTGCFNKRAFHLMADEFSSKTKKRYQVISVVVNNLDYIMSKNGHEQGNIFMSQLAQYIEQNISHFVYHTRGNTLTFIEKGSGMTALALAEKLSNRLDCEWESEAGNAILEASINIIDCPKYAKTTDELYDMMNFMAAESKNANVKIHTANADIIAEKKKMSAVAEILRKAIDNDGFNVVYQPIYSVKEKKFCSAEALVRLKDTQTVGFVSPDVFIPLAERTGMISKIGGIVFEKVCQCIREHKLSEHGVHYIEVNLSAVQCVDPSLTRQLNAVLEQYNIPPEFINLEITETAAVESGTALHMNMHLLKEMGCSFSMDDFGTGYSNLSKMAEVHYDLIKLDKSLVTPCLKPDGEKAFVILKSVVQMISQLNIKIVAEGVETREELEMLEKLGVDYIQGYYFSKPLSEADYIQFLYNRELQ